MEMFKYGVGLEERVEDFQMEVMSATIFRGLIVVGVKSFLGSLLGLQGNQWLMLTVGVSLIYTFYMRNKYKNLNVYAGNEVYSYKGNIRNFRDDTPGEVEVSVESELKRFMVLMSAGFVTLGMFLSDTIHILQEDAQMSFGLVLLSLAVTIIGGIPILYIYLHGYKWMVKFYVMLLQNAIVATIYVTKENNGEEVPPVPEYIEWKHTKERKRVKKYTPEDNAKFQRFHSEVESEIKEHVEIYPSSKRYIEIEPGGITEDAEEESENKDDKSKQETLKEFDIKELDETYDDEGDDDEQK